jgi:GMP synthase-like glutamine amidotransferase
MRALVLEHDPTCPLGRLEAPMAGRGISAEVVGPEEIPSLGDPEAYDLAVVLGADDSAYDDSVAWVPAELAFVRRAVESNVPVLGICFGAQMLARALGADVHRAPEPEVAWKSLTLSGEAGWLPAGPWLTWHQDTFDWPPEATPLAWTDKAPQAFSQADHLGLQFHPEATADLVERWVDIDRRKLALDGLDHDAFLAETRARDSAADEVARVLFERYFDRLVSRHPAAQSG